MDPARPPRAEEVLDDVRGTLLSDLRAMMTWASRYDAKRPHEKDLGALNFALALVSLVACETLGFYAFGARWHLDGDDPRRANVGAYLMGFMSTFFPEGSRFKLIHKILADRLRHELVHGFGNAGVTADFDVQVCVASEIDWQFDIRDVDARPRLFVNAVALADQVLQAFDLLRQRVASNDLLRAEVEKAARWTSKLDDGVNQQFRVVHAQLQREAARRNAKASGRPDVGP